MAKISSAGASDMNVDPDYIAPPGMAPQDAMDAGVPDAGQVDEPAPVDEPASLTSRRSRPSAARGRVGPQASGKLG